MSSTLAPMFESGDRRREIQHLRDASIVADYVGLSEEELAVLGETYQTRYGAGQCLQSLREREESGDLCDDDRLLEQACSKFLRSEFISLIPLDQLISVIERAKKYADASTKTQDFTWKDCIAVIRERFPKTFAMMCEYDDIFDHAKYTFERVFNLNAVKPRGDNGSSLFAGPDCPEHMAEGFVSSKVQSSISKTRGLIAAAMLTAVLSFAGLSKLFKSSDADNGGNGKTPVAEKGDIQYNKPKFAHAKQENDDFHIGDQLCRSITNTEYDPDTKKQCYYSQILYIATGSGDKEKVIIVSHGNDTGTSLNIPGTEIKNADINTLQVMPLAARLADGIDKTFMKEHRMDDVEKAVEELGSLDAVLAANLPTADDGVRKVIRDALILKIRSRLTKSMPSYLESLNKPRPVASR